MAEIGEPLSERELDVLKCVSNGASNKEIASELSISQNTVKVHLRNIYTKLGVSTRTEATTAAIMEGYIVVPNPPTDGDAITLEPRDTAAAEAVPKTSTNETASDTADEQDDADAAKSRSWYIPALIILLLISILAIGYLGWQVLNQDQQQAIEPFEDIPIGESRWSQSKPMPEGRSNMATASIGLDVYLVGGETDAGIDGNVQVFESVERVWRQATEKPVPVANASASELFGELYVPGGQQADGEPTAIVEAYSPSQDAWRSVAALPQPVAGGLTLSDGAFIYVIGGWNGEEFLDTFYVYDPSADSWRPLPTLPTPLADAAGGYLTGNLVIAGGQNEEGELASCYIYHTDTEEWETCPDMLLPRAGAGSAVLFNKLYVIGGGLSSDTAAQFSEVYDPNSQTWQVVNTPMLDESDHWWQVGVSNVESRIYAFGGKQDEEYMENIFVFAPLFQTYIPAAPSDNEN